MANTVWRPARFEDMHVVTLYGCGLVHFTSFEFLELMSNFIIVIGEIFASFGSLSLFGFILFSHSFSTVADHVKLLRFVSAHSIATAARMICPTSSFFYSFDTL